MDTDRYQAWENGMEEFLMHEKFGNLVIVELVGRKTPLLIVSYLKHFASMTGLWHSSTFGAK